MQEKDYKMAKMWVKPKGKSMVLVDKEEADIIIKENLALRTKKVVKKKVKKKESKEEE
jgi:hypothetical protein|tara:strand:+ start:476 stop:649 length:174 start_codon:yes stop_codon:yes gene_type:complete